MSSVNRTGRESKLEQSLGKDFRTELPPKSPSFPDKMRSKVEAAANFVICRLGAEIGEVTLKDFKLISTWEKDLEGPTWKNSDKPIYLIDQTTGRLYWNESKATIRFKAFGLTLGTPIVLGLATLFNTALRIARLMIFYHFWKTGPEENYNFKGRGTDALKDLRRIVLTPITLVGLELSAIYALLSPHNGRKLYATLERVEFGRPILAPCFQPDPTYHLFGGDPNTQNAF